jgi:hypothetical protein
MALCLADARSFDTWLIFLLVSDMWWWVYEARTRPVRARRVWCVLLTSNSCPDIRVPVEVDFPARTWVMNNLVTASLLIFFLRVAGPESSVILTVATVLAGVLNRVIDFKKTRFWMF